MCVCSFKVAFLKPCFVEINIQSKTYVLKKKKNNLRRVYILTIEMITIFKFIFTLISIKS